MQRAKPQARRVGRKKGSTRKSFYAAAAENRAISLLEKPRTRIESMNGKDMADELRDFARRQGIDLSLADLDETRRILKNRSPSLSDEVVKMREGND